jgi:hypothetical protein
MKNRLRRKYLLSITRIVLERQLHVYQDTKVGRMKKKKMLLLSGLDVVVKVIYENRLRHEYLTYLLRLATVHHNSMIIISFNVEQQLSNSFRYNMTGSNRR